MTLVTFALGATLAVLVAGSAAAAGSKGTTTTTTTKKTTTTTTTKTKTPTPTATTAMTTTSDLPGAHFLVINGTVNAASDHEIVATSAFPNYTTGAVDNYYSMSHSHVDNSPFAEGTASPADTGPIGQTAAAGNFQQPQYADARWPGDAASGKASYGSQGGPYAAAVAAEYQATADASEASNGLSAPGPTGAPTLPVPTGFDGRLRAALAGWKSTWQGRLTPKKKPAHAVTTPVATVPLPKLSKPTAPTAKVTTPTATVTTPLATVTTPNDTPPVTVPAPTLPSVGATGAPRSLASTSTSPPDGETLLTSSTSATLDSKTDTLLTSGESSLGRVSLGGGAIVIEGLHVTASITNDGNPSYKAAISIASATIGGVPVTIDEDGVHVAGQGSALPYQQASDALNSALKQAGIQLFLVAPQVTLPCGQTSTGPGGSTTTSTTTTAPTTTSSDQSGTPGSCAEPGSTSCDSSGGSGSGSTVPSLPSVGSSTTTTTSSNEQTDTTTTTDSCDQTGSSSCDQAGTTTNENGTTTTGGVTNIGPGTTTTAPTTTTTSTDQTDTTTTPSGCDQSGTLPSTSSCGNAGTTTGTTNGTTSTSTSTDTDTTAAPSPFNPSGAGTNSAEETVTATGLHVVFTQPVNESGVPAQYAEHILGEVFVDSLAVPAGPPPSLDLTSPLSSSSSSSSFSASTCGGGHSSKTTAGGASTAGGSGSTAGGSSSVGGSTSPGALSSSGSTLGSGSSSTGNSLPAVFATALRKPLWLLLAYLVWQALVLGTGASLWNWRRGEAP
jgi:mucin-2